MRRRSRTAAGGLRAGALRCAAVAVVALVVTVAAMAGAAFAAEQRLALVIGNAAYATNALPNPAHDARLIGRTLASVGFEVTTLVDADQATMKKAVIEFGRKLRASDAVGLFYYAGHGVQVSGENYLIPVGTEIRGLEEVALEGLSLTEVLRSMERGPGRLNIAILDACRDNPYPASTRSGGRGLAQVRAPAGTLVAFATGPGEVAYDGKGPHSPYSQSLAGEIPSVGIPLEEVFRRTRRRVLEITSDRQTPWEHSSLTGEFFFKPKSAEPEASLRPEHERYGLSTARLQELRDWERIKDTGDIAVLRAHQDKYPDGVFKEVAQLRIARLETSPSPWGWVFAADEKEKRLDDAGRLYEEAIALDNRLTSGIAEQVRAAQLFVEAARLGLPAAMYEYARCLDRGKGVAKDLAEAARWYGAAAEAGHVGAMASLGTMYEFGDGVALNLVEALRLYRVAADAGDPHGLTSLGFLYAAGKGVVRDQTMARRLYAGAAERGNSRAMYNLALLLMRGQGGLRDQGEAVRWLEVAAGKGHGAAMRELAFLYDEGRGVPKNPVEAARHLLASYKAGNREARLDVRVRASVWSFATRREIQRQLTRQGLYTGFAHGLIDQATRAALDRYASGE